MDFACGFNEQVRVPKTLMFSVDSAKARAVVLILIERKHSAHAPLASLCC